MDEEKEKKGTTSMLGRSLLGDFFLVLVWDIGCGERGIAARKEKISTSYIIIANCGWNVYI